MQSIKLSSRRLIRLVFKLSTPGQKSKNRWNSEASSKLTASLQTSDYDSVSTLSVGRDNVPGVHFCYCSTEEYERQIFLQTQFEQTRTIPGTCKLHSFIPISKDTLRTRIYSFSTITRENCVTKLPGDLELDEVSGFVTCSYNSQWWLGCVLEMHTKEVQIYLSLFHPPGPSRSYEYPDVPVIVTLPLTEILIKVCPRSQTGHVYTLTQRLKLVDNLETRTH